MDTVFFLAKNSHFSLVLGHIRILQDIEVRKKNIVLD